MDTTENHKKIRVQVIRVDSSLAKISLLTHRAFQVYFSFNVKCSWIIYLFLNLCLIFVVLGLLQCGSRCALWMVRRPIGLTPCPNSLRWMNWGCELWSFSTLSLRDRGSFTEANRSDKNKYNMMGKYVKSIYGLI